MEVGRPTFPTTTGLVALVFCLVLGTRYQCWFCNVVTVCWLYHGNSRQTLNRSLVMAIVETQLLWVLYEKGARILIIPLVSAFGRSPCKLFGAVM